MKGGVTCLGGMFGRRNKVKSAIIDDAVVKKSSHEDMSSEGAFKEFPASFLRGKEATVNHDARPEWAQGEVHVCVDPDEFVTSVLETTPAANIASGEQMVVARDVDSSSKPVTRSSSVNGVGDAEYEGEDDEEEVTGVRGGRECDSDHPVSEARSEVTRIGNCSSRTEALDNESSRYYDEISASGGYGSVRRVDNSFQDLEMASGHVSDPGVYHTKGLESACSSPLLSGGNAGKKEKNEGIALSEVRDGSLSEFGVGARNQDNCSGISGHRGMGASYESGSSTTGEVRDGGCVAYGGSPRSEAAYQHNADLAMFKYGASSGTLDAQRKKPWWKVFLASHRNIHREVSIVLGPLQEGGRNLSPLNGYVSDVEDRSGRSSPSVKMVGTSEVGNSNGRGSEKGGSLLRNSSSEQNFLRQSSSGMRAGIESATGSESGADPLWSGEDSSARTKTSLTVQKWDSFTEKTGLSRVEEWVSNVHPLALTLDEAQFEGQGENGPESPTAPAASFFHMGEDSPFKDQEEKQGPGFLGRSEGVLDADAEMAKLAVRSVNPLSTVAHFSGVGLKVLPNLGMFSSLKTLNLSANSFVRITPGYLPKSLHTLDLSRNQIVLIEGLRELTRLRVLNLSFNRIARIGNGLSSCMSLKELYLAGNKISEVEGLHRLSKLSVLDLSFNKLTTTKSLGQIAANYKSLQALNLLGNAVQSNLGDDHMRRFVTGVCPQVLYLNKQPLKTVSNRDAVDNTVARAALGKSSGGKTTTKPSKRAAGHSSTSNHRRTHSGGGGSKIKSSSKVAVSPVLAAQDPGHHRKTHHSRLPEKTSVPKELPRGFVPLSESAYPPLVDRKGRPAERSEFTRMPRVRSDGILYREARHSIISPQTSGGLVEAH